MRRLSRSLAGLLAAALLAIGGPAVSPAAEPQRFDRLVVFGDSLSDMGNAGRFSNGPVWVEHLAARLSLPLAPAVAGGTNYAVGGARIDPRSGPTSLRAQADLHLRGAAPPGRTLHILWAGGNDLLAAAGSGTDGTASVDAAVATLAGILADLIRRNATDLLVANLPDVGLTPAVRAYGPQAAAAAARLTERFNAGLDRALARSAATSATRIHRMDVHAMAARVAADPAAAGFRDMGTPCSGLPDCEGYLFWDHVHPTTAAHARLAEAALRILAGEDPDAVAATP